MSIKIRHMIDESDFKSAGLRPSHKNVAGHFADFANDEGLCWPSVGAISRKTEYDVHTVKRLRRDLIKAGVLVVVESSRGRGWASKVSVRPQVLKVLPPLYADNGGRTDPRSKTSSETLATAGSQAAKSVEGTYGPLLGKQGAQRPPVPSQRGTSDANGGIRCTPHRVPDAPLSVINHQSNQRGSAAVASEGATTDPRSYEEKLVDRARDCGVVRRDDEGPGRFAFRVGEAEKAIVELNLAARELDIPTLQAGELLDDYRDRVRRAEVEATDPPQPDIPEAVAGDDELVEIQAGEEPYPATVSDTPSDPDVEDWPSPQPEKPEAVTRERACS